MNNKNNKVHNKKRVQRLKKTIVIGTFSMLCLTTLLCIAAFIRVKQLEKELSGYINNSVTTVENDKLAYSNGSNIAGNYGKEQSYETLVNPSVNTIYDYEYRNNDDYITGIYGDYTANTAGDNDAYYAGYKKIYLTFDDGPSVNTNHILDILDEYGIKGTFFVNGHEGYEQQYIRIVNEGHSIGMHSFSHIYKDVYKDLDSFADDLYKIQSYIYDLTGVTCYLYRFPGGSSNQICRMSMQDCIDYLDAKGITYFDWNVSSEDAVAGGASVNTIVNNVINQITYCEDDTIVVLMHDTGDKHTTVEALPIIIEKLAAMENVVILPITANTVPVQHLLSH